eukprot:NODE_9_length_64580_cov_1.431941.p18 type:complete len:349 gc:universal NODE_9_length_64580_cov_1.431941:53202-54248(+)
MLCDHCQQCRAILLRPKTQQKICKECFFTVFELEVHQTIVENNLFKSGEKVAIGASGGKDSVVLAYILKLLNERYNYGLDLYMLSIDEGISGYRDDSLKAVVRNHKQYQIPLKILSYEELYGWTMDKIVDKIGHSNNCSYCGVFRRQALDRGSSMLEVDQVVTGHNADDLAETILMNILRGDISRLRRCTAISIEMEGYVKRSKPFKYTYEKEIVLYAYFKKLDYFSTECTHSPGAFRGTARIYLKELEKIRPRVILDIISSGEKFQTHDNNHPADLKSCSRCGYMSSQDICKACILLEGLNKGMPKLGVYKTDKIRKKYDISVDDESNNLEKFSKNQKSRSNNSLDF